jgi:hypothetical protein
MPATLIARTQAQPMLPVQAQQAEPIQQHQQA